MIDHIRGLLGRVEALERELERRRVEVPRALAVRVTHGASQSIAHNTITTLAFNTERRDTGGFHDTVTNNSRLTCPAGGAGLYAIAGSIAWDSHGTGERFLAIRLNGTTYLAIDRRPPASTSEQAIATYVDLAVGDFVELLVFQTSGVALNVTKSANYSPELGMVRQCS